MAVSTSAFGAHIIRLVDDMLRGPLAKASVQLREEAKMLKEKLKEVLEYAEDAENKVLEEDLARQWLAELRPLLFKAEEILEAYGADAQAERPAVFLPVMRRLARDRNVKQYTRSLLQNIDSVSKKRPPRLERKKKVHDQHNRSYDCQELLCHDNLVGTEIELKILKLVDKMIEHQEPSRQFIIFAIYGLGGIGKTTVARKIFDDQRTKSAFSSRLWVSISKGYSVSQILLATCAAIGGLEGTKTRSKLQAMLAEKIRGRKIFLVYDICNGIPSKEGIGNAEAYRNLIEVLRLFHAAAEGRVLIITSDENVGSEIKSAQIQKGAEGYGVRTHRLSQLTVEDGWTLLLRAACLEPAKVTPELKKISIGILQKCNGLPLAIKAVGGVLRQKGYIQKDWECIHNSRAFCLKDPSTGTEGGVRSSIYLSYQHALPNLKQCFLYLSLFPADFEIEQHLITQLWISEGLIDTRYGHSSKETSYGVESNRHDSREEITQEQGKDIDITLSRDTPEENSSASSGNVVHWSIRSSEQANTENNSLSSQEITEEDNNQQPPKFTSGHSSNKSLRKQSRCSVQEASIREKVQEMADRYFEELAEMALLQQENKGKGYKMHDQVRKIAESLTENEVCAGDPKDVAKLVSSLYRLSFLNKGLNSIPEEVGRLKNLRTLLLSGNPLGEKDLDVICKNMVLLRVLDLSDTEINTIPKTLRNLEHLRHLNLSRTRIIKLPESIDRLRRLRFLGLERCKSLTYLPKNIQKLSKLEYLNLRDTEITEPPRLQNMQHLTFLQGFVVDSTSSNGWLLEELKNMSNLTRLHIKIVNTLDMMTENGEVLKEKDNLRTLELSYCPVNSETLSAEEARRVKQVFGRLQPHQCLESLEIDGYYGSRYPQWLSSSTLTYLQQLNLVNFKFCNKLPPVWHLRKLKFLRIANLSELEKIDMEPRDKVASFPSLEELQVEDMEDLEYWKEFQAGDLPRLRKFSLRRCPKLKRLPGGLEHCKIIPAMDLRDAGLLDLLENIPVQELLVEAMPHLTTISNLPQMKVFTVISCPKLGIVSKVKSLQHVHMVDEQLDQLPKWLEQYVSRIETLDIVAKEELLQKCVRNKAPLGYIGMNLSQAVSSLICTGLEWFLDWNELFPDNRTRPKDSLQDYWPIIRKIPRVDAYLPDRLPFFSYTRSNDSFCKYQRRQANGHEDPTPAAAAEGGADARGAGVPSIFTSLSAGTKSILGGPARASETSRQSTPVESLVQIGGEFVLCVAVPIGFVAASHRDSWEAFCLLALSFFALGSLAFTAKKTTPMI